MLRAILVQSRAVQIVDVEIEKKLRGDPVRKHCRLHNVFSRNDILRFKMARLANADHLRGGQQIAIFIARRIFAQKIDDERNLTMRLDFRLRQIIGICAVDVDEIRHVDDHMAVLRRTIQQHMAGRLWKNLLPKGLYLAFRDLDIGFEGAGEDGSRIIDARDFEHQRDRLHAAVFVPSFAERDVRFRGDVTVACRVDDDFRQNGFASRLAFKNDTADIIAVHDDIRTERMGPNDDSRLIQLVEQHQLQFFMIDGGIACLKTVLHRPADLMAGVLQFVHDRRNRPPRPMGHHATGGDAAQTGVVFDNHHADAATRRRQSRRRSGRAAACDQNIRFGDDGNVPFHFMYRLHN